MQLNKPEKIVIYFEINQEENDKGPKSQNTKLTSRAYQM